MLLFCFLCSILLYFEQQNSSELTQLTQVRGGVARLICCHPPLCWDWVGQLLHSPDRQKDRKERLDWWSDHVTGPSQIVLELRAGHGLNMMSVFVSQKHL